MTFEIISRNMIDRYEQGYTEDAGGPTKYGISLRANPDLTKQKIKNLTIPEAVERYRKKEWKQVSGDSLLNKSAFIASLVFDYAVNSGSVRAVKHLQESLSDLGFLVKIDGKMGPDTLAKVNNSDKNALAICYLAKRVVFMSGLGNWGQNKNGWSLRLFSLAVNK